MKNKGFLLAEAIFSVFITFLIVIILQNLVKNLQSVEKIGPKTAEIAFSYVQFERFINESGAIVYTLPEHSNSRKAVFYKKNRQGEKNIYSLEYYQNMLRLTTYRSGHMPLLLHVKAAYLKTTANQICICLTEKDNRESDLYFRFALKKEDVKNKNNEKK